MVSGRGGKGRIGPREMIVGPDRGLILERHGGAVDLSEIFSKNYCPELHIWPIFLPENVQDQG